ncbi:hypothetical protein JHN59_37035 [Streptomyces sp. MBT49]|uniref:hypothetical protein n=1 Tax=unclassified Streptomyces TaxID=2593676 RepID=UPI00190BBE47|nr:MULTISPECIES: hypothetical protein [unclassified Streptomyces]MBK3630306.1 hypothetical protein [Streptomyces sp. MBT49]MBK3634693.1 hypothetical protein [Streptomyces sp. MBT97]
MDFTNEHELRAFLRLCIEPGELRDKRTPVRLAATLLSPVLAALAEHAPHVDAIRQATDADTQRAAESRLVYAAALLAWIRDEQPTRRARGLVEAGEEHVTNCVACADNGVISHLCPIGRRLVASFLAPSLDDEQEEAPCRHESWEVTSEYSEGGKWKTWVQARRCADCREPLPTIRRAQPHFPQQRDGETADAAALLGHATAEETTTAYTTAAPVARLGAFLEAAARISSLPQDFELDPGRGDAVALLGRLAADTNANTLPPVLAWAGLLDDDTLISFLVDLARVSVDAGRFQPGQARRVLDAIERTCATWQAVAITEQAQATAPGPDGEEPEQRDGFAAYCDAIREHGLTSSDGALVEAPLPGGAVHAAFHVSVAPGLELDWRAREEIVRLVRDNLAVSEQ